MAEKNIYILEEDPKGLAWKPKLGAKPQPYCIRHERPLLPVGSVLDKGLVCPSGDEVFTLKFNIQQYKQYVQDVILGGNLQGYQKVRIDSQGAPVLAKETNEEDSRYFIKSKLTDTSKGLELMIQVGKRDGSKKVQLFVDLPAERMGFDKSSKDMHPSGLFSEVRAIFKGSETKVSEKNT